MKSQVRGDLAEAGTGALAFSKLDMSMFLRQRRSEGGPSLYMHGDHPASQKVCTVAAKLLMPCRTMVSQVEPER